MSDQNALTIYTDHADRYEAAYAAFRRTYEVRVPPPVRMLVQSENRAVLWVLALIVAASILVSGSRTVGEFGGGVIGVAAFVMIECVIVMYAFIRTRTDYDAARHTSVKKRVNQGLALAFIVAVSANVHAELKHNGVLMAQWLDTAILVVLGISAPVLAFISGDVLGMYAVKDEQRQRRADEEYHAALLIWNEGLKSAWDREKAKWGVKVELEIPKKSLPISSNGIPLENEAGNQPAVIPSRSTLGHKKKPNASEVVFNHLNEYPADADMDALELADFLKVGKSTVYNVLKAWKHQQNLASTVNGNGHHSGDSS